MTELKDWSKEIEGLEGMEDGAVLNIYSEMLATAHDIGFTVPDALLIETENAATLKKVIPDLHEEIKKAYAAAKTASAEKASSRAKADAAKPEAVKKKRTTAAKADTAPAKTKTSPTKPAKVATQKGSTKTKDEKTMATTAKKAAPAKKAAKAPAKAAPAKKAAKAAPAKKAAKANARTPVTGAGRNPFGDSAVIKVLNKDTGIRADSERGKRVAVVFKYNGKKVADYYAKEQAPYNRTDTLRFLIDKGIISVK